MLVRRELLSGALLAEEFVVLTLERAGLLLVRLRLSIPKAKSLRESLAAGPEQRPTGATVTHQGRALEFCK
jgi:hypothetical protein